MFGDYANYGTNAGGRFERDPETTVHFSTNTLMKLRESINMPQRRVEEVFVTEGVPEYTFVPPPNYGEILVDIRRKGKPVIIEGQSGTGKTTCVRKILDAIGPAVDADYLSARKAEDVSKIDVLSSVPRPGTFVIDDFHRLADDVQTRLADIAKAAAEQAEETSLPKLVLIGINQVGSELIQLVPDIAKRTGIHRIQPGDASSISRLVAVGSELLNVEISSTDTLYEESKGDYWLTQQLCQTICTINGVYEATESPSVLEFEIDELRRKVVERLKAAYYPAVKEFCRGRRFRPTNDPYFKLLRMMSTQDSSIVDLDMLANAHPEVRGSINNIKARRLQVLLDSKPICARHFYYNSETKSFAIEDPALSYFLRFLDWDLVRTDCGFRTESRDYEYDIALSFAGENRELARHLAEQFEVMDATVFYDEYFEANFLGKTWNDEFKRIFAQDSRLVVCLLDENHNLKIWPTFERECFQPRTAEAAIIPVFLDDTPFIGIPKDLIGVRFEWDPESESWRDAAIDRIVMKVLERLEQA